MSTDLSQLRLCPRPARSSIPLGSNNKQLPLLTVLSEVAMKHCGFALHMTFDFSQRRLLPLPDGEQMLLY
jgi:hypothetical protein